MNTTTETTAPVATVSHNSVLRVEGKRTFDRQCVVTLSGMGARYGDYDGPTGMAKYAERLARNADNGRGRHNGAVWLSAEVVAVSASQAMRDLEAAERAADVHVRPGDVIRVVSQCPGEGGLYRVELPRPNACDGDSCRLLPVTP